MFNSKKLFELSAKEIMLGVSIAAAAVGTAVVSLHKDKKEVFKTEMTTLPAKADDCGCVAQDMQYDKSKLTFK